MVDKSRDNSLFQEINYFEYCSESRKFLIFLENVYTFKSLRFCGMVCKAASFVFMLPCTTSFTDPAFTGSIFVCVPLHHHASLPSIFLGPRSFQIRYAAHF